MKSKVFAPSSKPSTLAGPRRHHRKAQAGLSLVEVVSALTSSIIPPTVAIEPDPPPPLVPPPYEEIKPEVAVALASPDSGQTPTGLSNATGLPVIRRLIPTLELDPAGPTGIPLFFNPETREVNYVPRREKGC